MPAAIHGADKLPGLRAGTGLTVVSWLMRLGLLVSPPVVGLVADAVGLRVGLLVVPLAGALVLVLAGVFVVSRPRHDTPRLPAPVSSRWASLRHYPPGAIRARPTSAKEPFKGQKRPPCTRYAEVELVGACWAPHKLKAPCPETLFEHQGECYLPSFSAKPPPSSLGQ